MTLLFTASTVKDTLPNLERFVAGNLANGADHLFVFLDAPDDPATPEVRGFLDAHPSVTCMVTDDAWWQGDRPSQLNTRQRINANFVKALVSQFSWAEWVFHIDADEILQVDRSVLAGVPTSHAAVRLAPAEAVSRRRWEGQPTWFKRLLGKEDLTLLHVLGVIDRPSNGALFHGHVEGKSGVRPSPDVWLTLHHAVDADKAELNFFADPALRVLHYESYSGEDFVRKWTSILAAGPLASFRPAREPTAVALRALIDKGLSAAEAEPLLMRIFERTTEDDFDTLRALGLIDEIDPLQGGHRPATFPEGGWSSLQESLARLAVSPKRSYHPGEPADQVRRLLEPSGRGFRRR